jgi:hypothetical protein
MPNASNADMLRTRLKAAGFSDKEIDDYLKEHPEAKP